MTREGYRLVKVPVEQVQVGDQAYPVDEEHPDVPPPKTRRVDRITFTDGWHYLVLNQWDLGLRPGGLIWLEVPTTRGDA